MNRLNVSSTFTIKLFKNPSIAETDRFRPDIRLLFSHRMVIERELLLLLLHPLSTMIGKMPREPNPICDPIPADKFQKTRESLAG